MLECFEFKKVTENTSDSSLDLSLCFEQRQKSRGQAEAKTGEKVGWFIERGHVLADGDVLVAKTGEHIQIVAAEETLSEVHSHDVLALTKAAYHLGNRHVPLQIIDGYLHFQHDHVLDDMVRGLGLNVNCVKKPFHPESGAYHSHGGSHVDPDNSTGESIHEHGHHGHSHSHS